MTTSDQSAQRTELFDFRTAPELVNPQEDRWYKGASFNLLPTKREMRADLTSALTGWLPPAPIIHPDTRVFAMGSCFAAYFIRWLADQGFNQRTDTPYQSLLRNIFGFENVWSIAQQFRWAFGEVAHDATLWVDQGKQVIPATDAGRQVMRATIEGSEVLIITLGLSEVWYDRETGEPLWRAVPERLIDHSRHAFKVLSQGETVEHLNTIERLRATYTPHLKIVYTVSPVKLRATFRPISTLTANAVSKAIVRAGLDAFLREHPDLVNVVYHYFPSYELVTEVFRDPFEDDGRHVHEATVSQVLRLFAQQYTSLTDAPERRAVAPVAIDESHLPSADLLERIAMLEAERAALQAVCDERLAIIQELDQAARDRLAVIHELDAALKAERAAGGPPCLPATE